MSRALSHSELENFPSLEWTDIEPRLSPAIREALEIALTRQEGNALSKEQLLALANCEGDDLLGCCLLPINCAPSCLAIWLPTSSTAISISPTFVSWAANSAPSAAARAKHDTYFLSPDQVAAKAVEAWDLGATEVCIQGGLPHGSASFLLPRHPASRETRVARHAHATLSRPWRSSTAWNSRACPCGIICRCCATTASTLCLALRLKFSTIRCATSCHAQQAFHQPVARSHHAPPINCGIRSTSTLMYGHVETTEHWVNQLLLLREIQEQTGGFTEFVPLGFVHQNTLLFHQGLARSGPTLAEHLKIHALARIMLAGAINNIQVSWVKLNRNLSQLCLHAGANDYGGTLMEENISREAGATAGQYTSPAIPDLNSGSGPHSRGTQHHVFAPAHQDPVEALTSEHAMIPEFA